MKGLIVALLIIASAYNVYSVDRPFVVVIDAGHGGKDPGARGVRINEKEINLSVALKLGAMISANHADVRVIYTRRSDVFVELIERADIANRMKADLFISIHTNSLPRRDNRLVRGAETYTLGLAKSEETQAVAMIENSVILLENDYLQRYEGFDPTSAESYIIFDYVQNRHMEQSIAFASEIQRQFTSSGRLNRGVRQAGFLVLKATTMPSVLVELGFISNPDEERFMRSAEGQRQLAHSISRAFTRYKSDQQRLLKSSSATATGTAKGSTSGGGSGSSSKKTSHPAGTVLYKIQIFSSDKKIPLDDPIFKGNDVSFYEDGAIYKYTCGASTEFKEIESLLKTVSKDFKGAFIIRMKDGKRLR